DEGVLVLTGGGGQDLEPVRKRFGQGRIDVLGRRGGAVGIDPGEECAVVLGDERDGARGDLVVVDLAAADVELAGDLGSRALERLRVDLREQDVFREVRRTDDDRASVRGIPGERITVSAAGGTGGQGEGGHGEKCGGACEAFHGLLPRIRHGRLSTLSRRIPTVPDLSRVDHQSSPARSEVATVRMPFSSRYRLIESSAGA